MRELVLPEPLDPPVRPHWGVGAWVALAAAVVVEAFAACVVLVFVVFGASTACGQQPTLSNVHSGETGLMWATGLGLLPWALAMLVSRRRLWLAVLGLFSVTPLLYGISAGLDPQFWTGGFCF
jgi:hypothetical protein